MSEPFIAEIRMVGFNFAPNGWARCDGQLVSINQNQALFALVGTMYGGNGTTTFALPDLRGRVPIHAGAGPGLAPRPQGSAGGAEAVTLLPGQMPPHSHPLVATAGPADSEEPAGHALGEPRKLAYRPEAANTAMAPGSIAPAGGGQPHMNMQPYLAVNFVIALVGIFPPQP